jgi:broad specificity phosphatase PhoE
MSIAFGYTIHTMSATLLTLFIEPLLNQDTYLAFAVVSGIGLVFYFMQPRRFYIIRHGETLLNAEHIRQGEDGALSERGRQQAERLGRYLTRLPIQRIISSTYPRALETATIVNSFVHVPLIPSKLLVERRNPSTIIGKHTDDPEVDQIVNQIDLAYHDDDYRLLDEENFADLKQRARKCIGLFARQGARETVVVTHHVFLKILVAYMLYGERLHAHDFTKVTFFNFSDNAGITLCEFHPWKAFSATRGWEILTYNKKVRVPEKST